MSADTHDHDPHDDHHADDAPHGSRSGYWIGFGLAAILTAIPFWLVMTMPLSPRATAFVILGFAAVQMVVHMIFFLHMNRHVEGGWSIMALLFTIVVVAIAFSGSLWVMYHMNANMMPGQDMAQMG